MTTYSQVFSVKSNARRAARKQGVDPDVVVACAGGFHFPVGASPAPKAKADKPKAKGKGRGMTPKGKGESLVDKVHKMITATGGATMPEIIKATGWLEHTARARISGIAKKHKLNIERERLLGVTTYKAA